MFRFLWRTIRKSFFRKRLSEIAPDEIFMDSENLPHFDRHQMEGRLEYPLSPRVAFLILSGFMLVVCVFTAQAFRLQVVEGQKYADHSQNNRLYQTALFADRGVIFDRDGERLAWNVPNPHTNDFSLRKYASSTGVGHVLGYVKYPQKDTNGIYYQSTFIGTAGIELTRDEELAGKNGKKTVEVDALGNKKSENTFLDPEAGETLMLSIDLDLQRALFEEIRDTADQNNYEGGAGAIMDIHTGELLALVSYPEFDPQILTDGDTQTIENYLRDDRLPFLNRAVQGQYTPGSIVKPFMAVAALNEDVIASDTEIRSTGALTIPNPYHPDKPTVFRDWRAHGWTDMREAIAVSSDVYFYAIGGGLYQEHGYDEQEGLGIERIEKYMRKFGFGTPTGIELDGELDGVIPSPRWKEKIFGEDWLLGNTYHTSIGQFGFQVTPLQAVRATAALANGGKLLEPRLTLVGGEKIVSSRIENISAKNFEVALEGMRMTVNGGGTASGLNLTDLSIAAKTGTAEVGSPITHMHAWVIGFFPYEEPKYAFAVVMERAPKGTATGGVRVMRGFFDKTRSTHPEFYPN